MHPRIAAAYTSVSQHAVDGQEPSTFVLGTAAVIYAVAVLTMIAKLAGMAEYSRPPGGPGAASGLSHASAAKHAHESSKPAGSYRNHAVSRAEAVTGE
jgi:hypothetical protein